MHYSYRKLKGRITELYGTQTAFAQALGCSINSISKKLTGIRGFSQSDIEEWAKLLNINKKDYGDFFYT